MVRLLACALVVACSGGKARDDGAVASGSGSGSASAPADAAGASDAAPPAGGDLAVRVEWRGVPTAARTAPGRTSCNTPRAPSVSPTTMFQIPEALVFVEGTGTLPAQAHVRLGNCAFTPRVAVGAALVLESTSGRPVRATLAKWGDAKDLTALAEGAARSIQLPIAGHAVAVTLEPGAIYRLSTDDKDPETAWIVAAPAAVTEPSGQVTVHASPGEHAIRALVPARGGQPARLGAGRATAVTGELVEVAIELAP
ncbi:MAG: hypothetical protein KF773_41185 [Deltaproteobacteria bacterium]|nr:hypothetical protein [Deltaproteobacteria bacterium]